MGYILALIFAALSIAWLWAHHRYERRKRHSASLAFAWLFGILAVLAALVETAGGFGEVLGALYG